MERKMPDFFYKSAIVKVGGGHDLRKLRSNVMYNVFSKMFVF